jgi:hypothetical protein
MQPPSPWPPGAARAVTHLTICPSVRPTGSTPPCSSPSRAAAVVQIPRMHVHDPPAKSLLPVSHPTIADVPTEERRGLGGPVTMPSSLGRFLAPRQSPCPLLFYNPACANIAAAGAGSGSASVVNWTLSPARQMEALLAVIPSHSRRSAGNFSSTGSIIFFRLVLYVPFVSLSLLYSMLLCAVS